MTKSKISFTLPPALEEKTTPDELAEMLAEMLGETGGPLTAGERRVADDALQALL